MPGYSLMSGTSNLLAGKLLPEQVASDLAAGGKGLEIVLERGWEGPGPPPEERLALSVSSAGTSNHVTEGMS